MPAVVEADDEGTYVLKFRGAGQGHRALIAELIAGEIARALGLRVPELVFVHLDPILGKTERDAEIQDLINASGGLNLALDYLPGSVTFDPLVETDVPDAPLASAIVWLDAYLTNVDRTPRNPNMLVWHDALWLIDHGAALYFHHGWDDYRARSRRPFVRVRDHVLLPWATALTEADAALRPRLTPELLTRIVALVPDAWLGDVPAFETVEAHRAAYVTYLSQRLEAPRAFVEEARHAHARL